MEAWNPMQLGPPETIMFVGLRDVRVHIESGGSTRISATTTAGAWLFVVSTR